MKILKLSTYHAPEQVSSSHLTADLTSAYLAAGFTIENFVPTPTRGVSREVRAKYKKIKYEEQADGKVIIHRFSMFREGRNPIGRALRYFLVNLVQYHKGSHAKDVDLILAGSTPPTQGLLCGLVKKKLSKKYKKAVPFVYNLQDIFPDSLVNAKMTKKGTFLWKIGRKVEDFTYRHADKIIVISEDFKRNIMEKGVPEEKIVIIPNWVDTDQVYPIAREENVLFDRYGLDREKFYICYSGNVGHSQNLQLLLDAAKAVAAELPDVHFVIIGEGAAKEELAKAVADAHIRNMTLLPFQPYEDIAHVFSLGDAGLIISKPGIGGSSVPSKTWSIMAAERPVLSSFDADSALAKQIEATGCGLNAPAGDLDALVNSIKQLHQDRGAAETMGKTGREYVLTNLSKEKCTGVYVSTLKEAVEAANR